jgi:hypothetical protein
LEQVPHQTLPDDTFLLATRGGGGERALPALSGWRTIEVIRHRGIDLKQKGSE